MHDELNFLRGRGINIDPLKMAAVSYEEVLDESIALKKITDEEIIDAGLEIDGDFVIGFRTKVSKHFGDTIYEPGTVYS